MNEEFLKIIKESTGASHAAEVEMIQSLWSGYGKILRYRLEDSDFKTVVVKHVNLPDSGRHPRGWNTDISHQRKLKSYQVETHWYENWSSICDNDCIIPKCFAVESRDSETLMVLEDLDESGFPERATRISDTEVDACIFWLANFHSTYMQEEAQGLWETGTYWHLETRPDEFEALDDIRLKKAAKAIDKKLKESPYQTFVHGDAKLANFCFSSDGSKVAAVDFQYVGGGCGMKDLAYFIGSCMNENDCEKYEEFILDTYFGYLEKALKSKKPEIDFADLEKNWRSLYRTAWTDFHRFLKGWSPGHWKINSYSEKVTKQVVEELGF